MSKLFGRQTDPLKVRWRDDLPFARKCGDCRACCSAPEIGEKDFLKPLGVACEHLCESGCGLYEDPARPAVCKSFACNWLRGDGSVHQRPDRMKAMPVLAADRQQCALYLMDGTTPDTMTREARQYMRRWHRKRKTAVLLLHGDAFETTTAVFPDGEVMVQDTTLEGGDE